MRHFELKWNRCLDRIIPPSQALTRRVARAPHDRSFDAGRSPPHLDVVLESLGGREKLGDKRALVPGCGRGYDVETLAKYVAFATGLELAPTAIKSAQEYLESKAVTNASMIHDDFLSPKTDATFDLGYGACPLTTHRLPTHSSSQLLDAPRSQTIHSSAHCIPR